MQLLDHSLHLPQRSLSCFFICIPCGHQHTPAAWYHKSLSFSFCITRKRGRKQAQLGLEKGCVLNMHILWGSIAAVSVVVLQRPWKHRAELRNSLLCPGFSECPAHQALFQTYLRHYNLSKFAQLIYLVSLTVCQHDWLVAENLPLYLGKLSICQLCRGLSGSTQVRSYFGGKIHWNCFLSGQSLQWVIQSAHRDSAIQVSLSFFHWLLMKLKLSC